MDKVAPPFVRMVSRSSLQPLRGPVTVRTPADRSTSVHILDESPMPVEEIPLRRTAVASPLRHMARVGSIDWIDG